MSRASNFFGGGGSVPINTYKAFNSYDVLIEDETGSWLRTGYIETNPSLFPKAKVFVGGLLDSQFNVDSGDGFSSGLTWDGVNFWTIATETSANGYYSLHKYTEAGSLVASYVGFGLSSPKDLTFDGTNIVIVQSNSAVKYTLAGVPDGSFSYTGASIAGITHDGTNFWINSSQGEIRQYDSNFVATGVVIDVSTSGFSTSYTGVVWTGTHFWFTRGVDLYQHDLLGNYTGSTWNITVEASSVRSLAYANSMLTGIDYSDHILFKWNISNTYVGDKTPESDSDANGRPVYLKVG